MIIPFRKGPRPPAFAYLIASLDVRTLRIVRVGIYSEASPTMVGADERYLSVLRTEGKDFQEALERMWKDLAAVNPYNGEGFHDWALPLLPERDMREILQRRRPTKLRS